MKQNTTALMQRRRKGLEVPHCHKQRARSLSACRSLHLALHLVLKHEYSVTQLITAVGTGDVEDGILDVIGRVEGFHIKYDSRTC